MQHPIFRISVAVFLCGMAGFAAKKPRVGVVAIQDRKDHGLGNAALEAKLLSLLRSAGFDSVPLRFQPAADVDHEARQAGCAYILYTVIVDVHRTTATAVANAVTSSKKRDIWEAEVEFRIFAVDQVQPLLSTQVTGRNAKSHPGKDAPPPPATRPASEETLLTDSTPVELTGRQKKHKSVAVAAALEREVKMVRERLAHPDAGVSNP
jgi:hypothetical protein